MRYAGWAASIRCDCSELATVVRQASAGSGPAAVVGASPSVRGKARLAKPKEVGAPNGRGIGESRSSRRRSAAAAEGGGPTLPAHCPEDPAEALADSRQSIQKALPILVLGLNPLSRIAPRHHVIAGTCELNALRTRHAPTLRRRMWQKKT